MFLELDPTPEQMLLTIIISLVLTAFYHFLTKRNYPEEEDIYMRSIPLFGLIAFILIVLTEIVRDLIG